MELMSMLLFCAFVVRLPLTLGVQESNSDDRVKINSSILIVNSTVKSDVDRQDLNINASRKFNAITELHPFISDDRCKYCSSCVEKALDTHKNYNHFENLYPDLIGLQQNANNENFKRSVLILNNTETVEDGILKIIRITKYKTSDEKVYAIKVNEINNQISEPTDRKSTCKVYSVKKAYPCESEESNLVLMNRKVNKKRISKQKNTGTTTEKSIPVTFAGFKKRKLRVESSHVPESFMPSIEELY